MKTTYTGGITTKDELKRQIITRRSPNHCYSNRATHDVNHNATKSQIEQERDACEEELYRLRFAIENLLNNNDFDGVQFQQQRKFPSVQNPFRTVIDGVTGSASRKMTSWLDRCCPPCCRRWIRARPDSRTTNGNEYTAQNYPTSQHQTRPHSHSVSSTSPPPSVSSRHVRPNRRHTDNDLKHRIDNLISHNHPGGSNPLTQEDLNNPAYHSLIVKILEAKALDCLCSGYSKQQTQQQIQRALSDLNHRDDRRQVDSVSRTSSQSSNLSPRPSSASSIVSEDSPLYSPFDTSQPLSQQGPSPLPSNSPTPDGNGMNSTMISPSSSTSKRRNKGSSKSNGNIKSPKKSSKVTIADDQNSKTDKSKRKSRSSSKRRSSTKGKPSQRKKRSSRSKKSSRPSASRKQRRSSRSKKKGSSRSSSRRGRSKKRSSKPRARKK